MSKTIDGRIAYLDLFRAVALVGVILLHVSLWYLDSSAAPAASAAGIYSALTRWCVPAFAMLSGALILDPKGGNKVTDLLLRILRVLLGLCLWSAIYVLVDLLLAGRGLTLRGFLAAMESALLGNSHSILWFLYIIIGFYILSPILRAFANGASRAVARYALILSYLVAMVLPTVLAFFPNSTVSRYLDRLQLYPVLGYFFYFIAGYFFRHYVLGRVAEAILYVLGAVGLMVTLWGTGILGNLFPGGAVSGSLFTGYLSPTVASAAVAFFILFRYVLGVSDERGRSRGVTALARCSFGTFLIHEVFYVLLGHFGLFAVPIPAALAIPLWTAVILLPSFALAWLIHSIPVAGRYLA